MKKLLLVLTSLILISCTSISEKSIPTKVKGFDYNEVGSIYTPMHTELYISESKSDDSVLVRYSIQKYGYSSYGKNKFPLYILKKDIPNFLPILDKYLKWELIASEKGDLVDKNIGNTKVPNLSVQYKYAFFSGNEKSHFLHVTMCTYSLVDVCTDSISFDKNNVILLKQELSDIYQNKYSVFDDSDYQ